MSIYYTPYSKIACVLDFNILYNPDREYKTNGVYKLGIVYKLSGVYEPVKV